MVSLAETMDSGYSEEKGQYNIANDEAERAGAMEPPVNVTNQ